MEHYKVLNAEVNSDGTLCIEFERGDKHYTIDNVKLNVKSTREVNGIEYESMLRTKNIVILEIFGEFISFSSVNKVEDIKPLEVTIEEIEKKFGRKIKIVGDA